MLKQLYNSILDIGVKPEYQLWETHLTRKLNSVALVSLLNMVIGTSYVIIIDFTEILTPCIFAFCSLPLVIVLNYIKNYLWAGYWFYISGAIFFVFMNLLMGIDSYMLLFFFPITLSAIYFFNRRELFKHFVIISIILFADIITILIGIRHQWIEPVALANPLLLVFLNVPLSFFTIIAFILTISKENLEQEKKLKEALAEKEILLSEVFHRVKNNMNIVTSLLNLKKHNTDNDEVKVALEECQNRVYAMTLVHQKIFHNQNINNINFKEYIEELSIEILNSFGKQSAVKFNLDVDPILLDTTKAIPIGLIINEFITNSHKHNNVSGNNLQVDISFKKNNNALVLTLHDNGSGLPADYKNKPNSLGIELIDTLSAQLDAKNEFTNDNGVKFTLYIN